MFTMMENVQLKPMRARAIRWRSGIPMDDDPSHIKTTVQGVKLAKTLGPHHACLMRAHGSVAVGPSLKHAVFRAVYTEVNAKLQIQATIISGGAPLAALDEEEGRFADAVNLGVVSRPWDLWKMRVSK